MKKSRFKLLTIMLCIIFALQLTPIIPAHIAKADPIISGDYVYTLSASNDATITGYTGPGGDITIPTVIDTGAYPVIGIGFEAFYSHTDLTSITIPDRLWYI